MLDREVSTRVIDTIHTPFPLQKFIHRKGHLLAYKVFANGCLIRKYIKCLPKPIAIQNILLHITSMLIREVQYRYILYVLTVTFATNMQIQNAVPVMETSAGSVTRLLKKEHSQ
jgi:hypothetical protein